MTGLPGSPPAPHPDPGFAHDPGLGHHPGSTPPGLEAASARFLRAAAAEADVVYAELDSPVGPLVAAATQRGLARLAYRDFNGGLDAVLEAVAARLSPRIVAAPARLDDVRRQLDEFFAGRRQEFDLPVDLASCAPFGRAVLEQTARIPFGGTSTYRDIATALGRPGASRATGNALGANPVPIVVPCHRVLRTGGGLGGYTGGLAIKERLLGIEGVILAG
jgi:methylated-DNA-[protein]-cysteine S-methyltransferase